MGAAFLWLECVDLSDCVASDRRTLGTAILVDLYTACLADLRKLIDAEQFLTLSMDGWTDRSGRSLYAITVTMGSDRRTFLLHTVDLSAMSHTGQNLSGKA